MTARRLPADIARCLTDGCPKAPNCQRTDPPPKGRSRRQVYAAFHPHPVTAACEGYMPRPFEDWKP